MLGLKVYGDFENVKTSRGIKGEEYHIEMRLKASYEGKEISGADSWLKIPVTEEIYNIIDKKIKEKKQILNNARLSAKGDLEFKVE